MGDPATLLLHPWPTSAAPDVLAMSLRRAIVRTKETASLLRKTPKKDQTRLGTYPVPPEQYVWWQNRFQVPGGQIQQSFTPYQQKVMWQYFWNFPSRWYWRFSK